MKSTATMFRVSLAALPFLLPLVLPRGKAAWAAESSRVVPQVTKHQIQSNFSKLSFEANRGQTDGRVKFLSRGPGYTLFLTPRETVLVLSKKDRDAGTRKTKRALREKTAGTQRIALRMRLIGANPSPGITGLDKLPGKSNYLIGKDRSKWRTNVPRYAKVWYDEVYPGIDVLYYGKQRQLEFDFIVAPGSDPKAITLGFEGAERIEIDDAGDLVLHTAGGQVRQHKPVVYQEVRGVRKEIRGGYVLKNKNTVGFKLAGYDKARPLVIDPILSYSTYLGGNGSDSAWGIAVDGSGVYVTGTAWGSTDFPTTSGAVQDTLQRSPDAFVAKLDPEASGAASLIYSTYLGGNQWDLAEGMAIDSAGNAYVTGYTSSTNFPTLDVDGADCGPGHPFVVKLAPDGSSLVYSTCLTQYGPYGHGYGIAIDGNRNAYVTGLTDEYGGVFFAKLNETGGLIYEVEFGAGNYPDIALEPGCAEACEVYITGTTRYGFPTTPNAFQTTFGGGDSPHPWDGFVVKIGDTGNIIYSTYLGGNASDAGYGIAVDASGNAYVTGYTSSEDFPLLNAVDSRKTGKTPVPDAFVTKLNADGSAVIYSTYLGGSQQDIGWAIAADDNGNAYVTGATGAPASAQDRRYNFPVTGDALQGSYGGGESDAFVTKLSASGGLVYSSFLGGNNSDSGFSIAVDANGNAYIGGDTSSGDFPTTTNAFQPLQPPAYATGDAFVAKVSADSGGTGDPGGEPDGTGTIKGTVTDTSGNLLRNVQVTTDKGQTTTTNRRGKYSLREVPAGNRTVTVTGCAEDSKAVTLAAGETATVDFELSCP